MSIRRQLRFALSRPGKDEHIGDRCRGGIKAPDVSCASLHGLVCKEPSAPSSGHSTRV